MVLPAPEGPTSATRSPAATFRESAVSAGSTGRDGYANVAASIATVPRDGSGKGEGEAGAAISGGVSSISSNRSVAPAARCSSPATSLIAPTEVATITE